MVFARRSKGNERQKLLAARKGERSEDAPRVLKPKLVRRLSGIFKKNIERKVETSFEDIDIQTAPPTPDSAIDIQIIPKSFSEPPAPEELSHAPEEQSATPEEQSHGATTISDLSQSVTPSGVNRLSEFSNFQQEKNDSIDDDIIDRKATHDAASKTAKRDINTNTSCSAESVVANLLGLMDQTCGAIPMSSDAKSGLFRADSTANRVGTVKSWGTRYSDAEEDTQYYGSTIASDEKRENSESSKASSDTRATAEFAEPITHEDFELILDLSCIGNDSKRRAAAQTKNKNSVSKVEKKEIKEGKTPSRYASKKTSSQSLKSPINKLRPFVKMLTKRKNDNANTDTKKMELSLKLEEKGVSKDKDSLVLKSDDRKIKEENLENEKDSTGKNVQRNGPERMTIDLLGEGELLGEEYLEENERKVLRASQAIKLHKVMADNQKSNNITTKPNADLDENAKKPETVAAVAHPLHKSLPIRDSRISSSDDLSKVQTLQKQNISESEVLSRTSSSPSRILCDSKNDTLVSRPVNMWKSTQDPDSGRLYYYHRLTRMTTWSKPHDFDALVKEEEALRKRLDQEEKKIEEFRNGDKNTVPKDVPYSSNIELSAIKQKKIEDGVTENSSKEKVSSILKKTKVDELNEDSSNNQKEKSSPVMNRIYPEDISLNNVRQYEDHGDAMITDLQHQLKSQPFDEPAEQKDKSKIKTKNAEVETENVHSVMIATVEESSLPERTQTDNTSITNKTEATTKTDKTQRISNMVNDGSIGFQAIKESDEMFDDDSLSSHNEAELPPLSNRTNRATRVTQTRRKTFERTRDLRVEEFTSSRFGLATENFNELANTSSKNTVRQRRLNSNYKSLNRENNRGTVAAITSQLKKCTHASSESEDNYSGDNDTDLDTLTDTVSVLSHPDFEFQTRQENFNKARRQALDDAIRRKDWDLAASVTDHIKNRSLEKSECNIKFKEWTQSEFDKFISKNDWDAVASYIAYMRDNNETQIRDTEEINRNSHEIRSSTKKGSSVDQGDNKGMCTVDSSVKKRFGARSQLQHEGDGRSLSSWDSESFWESDYSSQTSVESGPHSGSYLRPRKEFAC